MAFNQTQFFESLEKLTNDVISNDNKTSFIYKFLNLLGVSKSTVTALKKNDKRFNVAINHELGEVANKQRIYFKPVEKDSDLNKALNDLKDSSVIATHKIRMIMVTDFDTVLIFDTKFDEVLDCEFTDLYKNYHFLLPLAGLERAREYSEHPADVHASEKMGRLFDHIKNHNEFNTSDDTHALNIFLTRLLFCFYAEDTGIFKPNQFHDIIESTTNIDGSDVDIVLYDLFETLDLPESSNERKNKPTHHTAFPYVNGGLFEQHFAIPEFNARTRRTLLECSRLNWSEINPDIFGSMFQAVIDPEQRGQLGQHYTSVSNIMKVLQPLFLDELREELDAVIELSDQNRHKNNKEQRLNALLDRISKTKLIDPSVGAAGFLITAYKELRKLEIDILKAQRDSMKGAKENSLGLSFDSAVSLNNFYGIEYDHFACQIARLSLWLSEHQMNVIFEKELGVSQPMLPLKDSGHIVHGNSLRIDWNEVCPNNGTDEIYVVGNPPFGGSTNRTSDQSKDMTRVFEGLKTFKSLDYVASWFYKGAKYIANSNAKLALVSTNSIVQGAQVATLFPPIFDLGVDINFAYNSFPWSNNAKHNAGVHVIIIGLSPKNGSKKTIFKLIDKAWHSEVVDNISPYLVSGSNIAIQGRSKPIHSNARMIFGSMPNDSGNLLMTIDEKNNLVNKEPKAARWIKKILGSEEFINGKDRYCLWLKDATESELDSMPPVKDKLDSIRSVRLKSKRKTTKDLSITPHLFGEDRQPTSGSYILIPRVSSDRRKYIPIGFFNHNIIASDACQIVPNGTLYDFAILTSLIHNDWMRLVAGRLESRYRYSSTVVYNTFQFPDANDNQKKNIKILAEEILLARADNVGKTMAELYDPDTMPDDLKQAHANLDDAVDKLYRPQGFKTSEERLTHLLARYEKAIASEK